MRINPINFTGIKNVGYAKISSGTDGIQISRNILNMELTDDEKNKDLSEFKKLIKQFPMLKNEFNNKFVNIELTSVSYDHADMTFIPSLNGQPIPVSQQTKPVLDFMRRLVDRVSEFKQKDFTSDPMYSNSPAASKGLIYDERLSDYVTGIAGELDVLKGSGIYESYEDYFENSGGKLARKDARQLAETTRAVAEVLHNPQYVHNGSVYLGALLKGYSDLANDKYFS